MRKLAALLVSERTDDGAQRGALGAVSARVGGQARGQDGIQTEDKDFDF